MSIFLSQDDVAILTGKKLKSAQVEELRKMGIAFFVNSSGRPVVLLSALEGRKQSETPHRKWKSAAISHG